MFFFNSHRSIFYLSLKEKPVVQSRISIWLEIESRWWFLCFIAVFVRLCMWDFSPSSSAAFVGSSPRVVFFSPRPHVCSPHPLAKQVHPATTSISCSRKNKTKKKSPPTFSSLGGLMQISLLLTGNAGRVAFMQIDVFLPGLLMKSSACLLSSVDGLQNRAKFFQNV